MDKIKVDFLIVHRFKGNVIRQSSVYMYSPNRKIAEEKAYAFLTNIKSPYRSEIILIDTKED